MRIHVTFREQSLLALAVVVLLLHKSSLRDEKLPPAISTIFHLPQKPAHYHEVLYVVATLAPLRSVWVFAPTQQCKERDCCAKCHYFEMDHDARRAATRGRQLVPRGLAFLPIRPRLFASISHHFYLLAQIDPRRKNPDEKPPANPVRMPVIDTDNGQMDVISRLLKDRILLLGQGVDDEVANVLVAQLLYLANEDPEKDITLYINSPVRHL